MEFCGYVVTVFWLDVWTENAEIFGYVVLLGVLVVEYLEFVLVEKCLFD